MPVAKVHDHVNSHEVMLVSSPVLITQIGKGHARHGLSAPIGGPDIQQHQLVTLPEAIQYVGTGFKRASAYRRSRTPLSESREDLCGITFHANLRCRRPLFL